MSMLERLRGKMTGTVKQAERGRRGANGTTEPNMGGSKAGTPEVPALPLDDDGNDARNIGG